MPNDSNELQRLLHSLVTDSYEPLDLGQSSDPVQRSIWRSLNVLHDQKQALVRHYNEDIQNSEARLRQIIETTPVGICITDEEALFEYVNPTYCRLYGYQRDELIGREFTLVVPPEYQAKMRHLHDEFMGHRYELRGEWSVVRKDGSRMSIIADAAYIIDVDGRPKKVTFVLDISARKQAEEALRETIERLNAEIEERKRLEKIRAQVEQMIRHDLRNPLTGIIAAVELLLADETTEEQQELLVMIRESGRKLDSMLNSSMDLIRMEEGSYELRPEELNLVDLVHNVDKELKRLAQSLGVELTYAYDDVPLDWGHTLPISGERIHLEDMLANIVRNAIEASEHGDTVAIVLRSHGAGDGGPRHLVEVHNRRAVPEEIRDTFFERYATSGKRHGTGLGTYVARLIAKVHGGELSFTTSEADGTRVCIELPALSSRARR